MADDSSSVIDLSVSPSSGGKLDRSPQRQGRKVKCESFSRPLPSSQTQEQSLLGHGKLAELLEDCEDALNPAAESRDSDEGLWNGFEPQSLVMQPGDGNEESDEEDLLEEARALQAGLRQEGALSRAEEKRMAERRDRQALLDIIRTRKKKRRSQDFASETSSEAAPYLIPESSPAPQRQSRLRRSSQDDAFVPASLKSSGEGEALETMEGVEEEKLREEKEEKMEAQSGDDEEEAIPWSSSPVQEPGAWVLYSDATLQPDTSGPWQSPTWENARRRKKRRSEAPPEPAPPPEIVDLVSEEESERDDEWFEPLPHSQFASQPAPPPPPIWDVPDSPEPAETYSMTFLHDLDQTDREFFENHYKRPARGQVEGESGHEKQARNMALGIGTAKEAAAKKRASAAKKSWSRGSWGRGRGRGRARGRK